MHPIEDRVASHHFVAAVTHDNVFAIAERINPIITSGRHITLIRRSLRGGPLDIKTALVMNKRHMGSDQTGVVKNERDGWRSVFWSLNDSRGRGIAGFGFSGALREWGPKMSETDILAAIRQADQDGDNAPRGFDAPRDIAMITVDGWAERTDVKIVLTTINEHGYGEEITLVFDYVSENAEMLHDVATLRALADRQPQWTTEELRGLGDALTYYGESLADRVEKDTWDKVSECSPETMASWRETYRNA